jgi:MFS transporter, YNFM family, putative membrane transport protein
MPTRGHPAAASGSVEGSVECDGLPADLRYHRPGQRGYQRLLVALFLAGVATFAALYSTQPLLGILAQSFSVPESHAAWSVSVTTLLLGVGMLAAVPLSDRWGRTRLIKSSLFATAALGALCALAPTWPILLAARAAQGLALAGTPAVALVYLREEVHASVHPRTTGLYIGGTAIGGMTGRLLAGGLTELGGWRCALGGIAVLSGFCALVVVCCLPASRYPSRMRYLAVDAAAPPAIDTWRQALGVAGRVLGDRQLLGLDIIAGTLMGAFVAVYNVLGLRLTTAPYRLSVFEASLVFCVYPLGAVASTVAGRLAERLGRPPVVLLGSLFAIAGVAVTLLTPLTPVVVGVAMITIGFFAAHGVASGWAAALGQGRHQAASQASALYLLSYYLGSTVFGAIGTGLWSSGRWPAVAAMAAGLMALAAIIAARETRR